MPCRRNVSARIDVSVRPVTSASRSMGRPVTISNAARYNSRPTPPDWALHMLQRVRAASIEELRYNRTAHAILDGLESHAKPSIRCDLVPLREAAGLPG